MAKIKAQTVPRSEHRRRKNYVLDNWLCTNDALAVFWPRTNQKNYISKNFRCDVIYITTFYGGIHMNLENSIKISTHSDKIIAKKNCTHVHLVRVVWLYSMWRHCFELDFELKRLVELWWHTANSKYRPLLIYLNVNRKQNNETLKLFGSLTLTNCLKKSTPSSKWSKFNACDGTECLTAVEFQIDEKKPNGHRIYLEIHLTIVNSFSCNLTQMRTMLRVFFYFVFKQIIIEN